MATVIFVHGTGVRKESYEATFDLVKEALSSRKPGMEICPCLWGDDYGVKLHGGGASIPTYATARAIGILGVDEDIALWGLLYQDPLYELRLLASKQAEGGELVPGQAPPWTALQDSIDQLQPDSELEDLLDRTGHAAFWNDAYTG